MLRLLKFTLDLFDVAPVYEPAQKGKPKAESKAKPKRSKKAASPPVAATTPVLTTSGTVFSRHPQASQQTRLVGQGVDYELLRSRRRTMTFSVSTAGLSVRAPFGMTQHAIEAAVQEKAHWIVRKLGGMQERDARVAALKMDWQAGASLDYLGQTMQVRLVPSVARTALVSSDTSGNAWTLQLPLPLGSSDQKIRDATKKWLVQQATQHYTERMNHYAPMLGVTWRTMTLSSASTRWGSAKADGSIRLHWRLMQFSPEVIDYVVAHELSHLRELNHSPRFWATLARVMPDYAARQKLLKTSVLPPWE